MYQVVAVSSSPSRRMLVTSLDTKDNAKQYLDGQPYDGEVVDGKTGLLKAEKVDGTLRDVLTPTRRDIL